MGLSTSLFFGGMACIRVRVEPDMDNFVYVVQSRRWWARQPVDVIFAWKIFRSVHADGVAVRHRCLYARLWLQQRQDQDLARSTGLPDLPPEVPS